MSEINPITPAALVRECISKEVFEAFRDDFLSDKPELTRGGNDHYQTFTFALRKFFERLPDTGVMKRCDLGEHFSTSTLYSWNALADNLSPSESNVRYFAPTRLAERYQDRLVWRISIKNIKDKILMSYEEMVDFIACGTLDESHPPSEHCEETGSRIHTFIKDWGLEPCSWNTRTENWRDGGVFSPLVAPETADSVQHAVVNFPSGRVIYADMIRLQPLIDIIKPISQKEPSSSIRSICEVTRKLAELGVVHVYSSNSSPYIYRSESALTVGHDVEETNTSRGDFKTNGDFVCTDLWWVTLVDEARLIEILAQSMSTEQAKSEIDKYLIENHGDTGRLEMEPGEYQLYFHGNPRRIREDFVTNDIDLGSIDYQFVLSKEPLNWQPKQIQPSNKPKR